MLFMNEYDIENAERRFDPAETPNLARAARALHNLMVWTNANSDGWPYWAKPCRAAEKLQKLLTDADRFDPQDVTPAQLTAALRPVKSFLTRQGADSGLLGGRRA